MTTIADLREALIACEQPAPPLERLLRNVPSTMDDLLADEIPLMPDTPRRRRRPALWLTAAAVVVALSVGGVVLFGQGSGRSPADGGNPPNQPLTVDQLTVPFTIDASAGVQPVQYEDSSGQFVANLADRSHLYQLVISPRGSAGAHLQNTKPVEINGVEGHLAVATMQSAEATPSVTPSGSALASASQAASSAAAAVAALQAQPSVDPSSMAAAQAQAAWALQRLQLLRAQAAAATAIATMGASAPQESAQLDWATPAGGSALLQGEGAPVSEDRLVAVARTIHFVEPGEPGAVLHTVLSLSAAPAGMQLIGVGSLFRFSGDSLPKSTQGVFGTGTDWQTDAWYQLVGAVKQEGVQVSVSDPKEGQANALMVGTWTKDAQAVTVDGHAGYWSPSESTLSLDLGGDVYLNIESTGAWNANPAFSYEQIAAIAKTVTVAKNPKDTSTWFNAATALPTGP